MVQITTVFNCGATRVTRASNEILSVDKRDRVTFAMKVEGMALDAGSARSVVATKDNKELYQRQFSPNPRQERDKPLTILDGKDKHMLRREHRRDPFTMFVRL